MIEIDGVKYLPVKVAVGYTCEGCVFLSKMDAEVCNKAAAAFECSPPQGPVYIFTEIKDES